jgi:HlyD family secretion protein
MRLPERRRSWWIFIVVGVVVLLVVAIVRRDTEGRVRVAAVKRGRLVATVSTNGKVEPIRPYELRAQAATFVRRALVKEGDVVRAGQKLLDLEDNELRSQLADARKELVNAEIAFREGQAGGPADEVRRLELERAQAKLDLEQAERNYQALQKLLAKQAASEQEVAEAKKRWEEAQEKSNYATKRWEDLQGRAKSFLESVRFRLEEARNRVQALEAKLHSIEVVAPVNGTVYGVEVKAGDYVRVGDLLIQMADLRQVQVIAYVDEPELGQVKAGQAVKVTWEAYAGRTWEGQIERVPAAVVAHGTRSVGEVVCRIENPTIKDIGSPAPISSGLRGAELAGSGLLPNVNVNVQILVRQVEGALLVPREAVTTEDGRRFVFVVDEDTVRRRAVETGSANFAFFEVVSGLKENDRVALPGEYRLQDGQRVRATE